MRNNIKILFGIFFLLLLFLNQTVKSQDLVDAKKESDIKIILMNDELFSEIKINGDQKRNQQLSSDLAITAFNSNLNLFVIAEIMDNAAYNYFIINNLGQTILKGILSNEKTQIDLKDFSPGLYYLSVLDGKNYNNETIPFSVVK